MRSLSMWTLALSLILLHGVKFSDQFEDDKYLSYEKFGKMRGDEIIRYYGYPGEEHKVLTEDGYILTNFRIANPGGYPVLFFHGMTATSDCWLVGGPAHDMTFRLWKRGYDVWLWNARGNMYSTQHVNISHADEKFYLFSMHELGIYDAAASIDYILKLTGHKDVITIGHSMGTTNILIATSTRPEYQAKVRLNILWAQGVFLGHVVVKSYADMSYSMHVRWLNFDNLQRMLTRGSFYNNLLEYACADPKSFLGGLCLFFMEIISGLGSKQAVKLPVLKMVTKFPAGTSLNVIKQQAQNSRSGNFKPLTFGRKGNLERYGTKMPKPYPIHRVSTPTAIYYGCCNDFLSHVKDVYRLNRTLPNVARLYKVPYKWFNHGDFLWAKDGYKLLYRDTLLLIDKYTPPKYRSNITIV